MKAGAVHEHAASVLVDRRFDDVTSVLTLRPARWLNPFLVLALRQDSVRANSSRNRPRYRVGNSAPTSPASSAGGIVRVPFVWRPHRNGNVFESFAGAFGVVPSRTGCTLELNGRSTGGEFDRCQQVLDELMHLLGEALSARQGSAE